MYSNYRSPPPAPRVRRPWSPDPRFPLPALSRDQEDYYDLPLPTQRRREPSDASVEALDLADYAAALSYDTRFSQARPEFPAYGSYPPSPDPFRPFASPDSDSMHPPSLVSPSATSSNSSPRSPLPIHRPFSLPVASYPDRAFRSRPAFGRSYTADPDPRFPAEQPELDIAHFPAYSKNWYETSQPPGVFSPSSQAFGHAELSPFDPAFPTHAYDGVGFQERQIYSPPPSYPYSLAPLPNPYSSRDNVVPWNVDPESGDIVDPGTKEERMRMLEQEFGGKQPTEKEEREAQRKALIGTVDDEGNLITAGPRKRIAMRWLEVLLALGASAISVYLALIIKVPSPPPPQQHVFSTYMLYVFSILTFLGATYMFFINPCRRRRRTNAAQNPLQGPAGMMVMPVQSMPSGNQTNGNNRNNRNNRNQKGGEGDGRNAVQVNLIVDPSMFGGGERVDESDEDEDEDTVLPSSSVSAREREQKPRHRPRHRRRGIFAGLAMEAQWKDARRVLRWNMMFDIHAVITWAVQFVTILKGDRCPPGGFNGWCNAYNIATALSCFLSLTFGISLFFDIKDMYASRASPRTRP